MIAASKHSLIWEGFRPGDPLKRGLPRRRG